MKIPVLRMLSLIIVIVMFIVSSPVSLLAEMNENAEQDVLEETPQDEVLEEMAKDEGIAEAAEQATSTVRNASEPLRIGVQPTEGDYNVLCGKSLEDKKIADLTQLYTLTNDRNGDLVLQGIDGEIRATNGADYVYYSPANLDVFYDDENHSTTYIWTLRNDLKFSDGTPLTVDDLIFTLYVLSDPSYVGMSTFYTLPIRGMNEYRTQTPSLVYEKYASLWDEIIAAGPEHELVDVSWTPEMEDRVWDNLKTAALDGLELVISYVDSNYAALYAEGMSGLPVDELREQDLLTALAMSLWGFGEFAFQETDLLEDPSETEAVGPSKVAIGYLFNDRSWDFSRGEHPTVEDFLEGGLELYEGDYAAFMKAETSSVGGIQAAKVQEEFIAEFGVLDEEQNGGVPSIDGISRLSDTQVEIVLNGFDAAAVHKLNVPILPLHLYGDTKSYDYENDHFGLELGDVSNLQDHANEPVGAGPYIFKDNGDNLTLKANPYYYRGEPKVKEIQVIEIEYGNEVKAIAEGQIDIMTTASSMAIEEEIEGYSSDDMVAVSPLGTTSYDAMGYGYIGLNAATVNVEGRPGSEASKHLRRALATVLAPLRSDAIASYYGDSARVIEYPMSTTSWAAPQSSDPGYQYAYSRDVLGEALYASDDNHPTKALRAATDFLLAAGYTMEDGIFTEAPLGAKLEYEVIVPGLGKGDHASYAIVEEAADLLREIGITLNIVDLEDPEELWERLEDGSVELWCAERPSSLDADPHPFYHSSNIAGGTEANYYHIADDRLDELIMTARMHYDLVFRKETYLEAMDIVLDWAVEVPVYQRQDVTVFSNERLDLQALVPHQTGYYDWLSEIWTIELK